MFAIKQITCKSPFMRFMYGLEVDQSFDVDGESPFLTEFRNGVNAQSRCDIPSNHAYYELQGYRLAMVANAQKKRIFIQ